MKRLFILTLSLPFLLNAQLPLVFSTLTVKDGLSHSNVGSIAQDKQGFIWFGTGFGLNKYDGYSITIYNKDRETPFHLPSFKCENIAVDVSGNIIVADPDIISLDWESNQFIAWKKAGTYCRFVTGKEGSLWGIGMEHQGLYFCDSKTHLACPAMNLGDTEIYDLFIDHKNILWFSYGNSHSVGRIDLNEFYKDKHHATIRNYSIKEHNPQNFFSASNRIFMTDRDGIIYLFDQNKDSFLLYSKLLKNKFINTAVQDSKGNVWIGTENHGLFKLDSILNLLIHYTTKSSNLSSNNILSLLIDRTGIMWVGTGNGVSYTDLSPKSFRTYKYRTDQSISLPEKAVRGIACDKNGIIWASVGNDLAFIDERKNSVTNLNQFSDEIHKRMMAGFGTYTIIPYEGNCMLAIGVGLNKIDLNQKALQYSHPNPTDSFSLREWICLTGHKGKKTGTYYIGTYKRLYKILNPSETSFIPGKETIMPEKIYCFTNSITGAEGIWSLFEDHEGLLWIGTTNGVFTYDPYKNLFEHFSDKRKDPYLLSQGPIKVLFVDSKNNIWVGTEASGLFKYNKKNDETIRYSTKEGLSNNNIAAIQEDDKGRLWISTGGGLNCFDPITNKIKIYSYQDGLQSNEFTTFSSYKTNDGRLCFGGVDGLTIFNPDSIYDNIYPPKTIITKLYLFNKPVYPGDCVNGDTILRSSLHTTNQIILSHLNNIFSIEFIGLHFSMPEMVRYKYRLDGLEQEWQSASSNNRVVHYSNLPPGRYTFMVKSANKDEIWGNTASLHIIVLPPWWETLWFKTLLIVIIVIGSAGIFWGRIKQIEYQKNKLQLQVAEQTEELRQNAETLKNVNSQLIEQKTEIETQAEELKNLNATKDKFFSIIAHDLRNPFHGIMNSADALMKSKDRLKEDEKDNFLKLIHESSKAGHALLENLLTWARTQSDKIPFKPESTDLRLITESAINILQTNARQKGILLENKINEEVYVYADPNMVATVIRNLINNSIKFTSQGKISVFCQDEGNMIKIIISDTGIGMNKEIINKLLRIDVHHTAQGTSGESGTGLGLVICREFIEKNNGEIWVESEPGKGSNFIFLLPKSDSAPHKPFSNIGHAKVQHLSKFDDSILLKENTNDTEMPVVLIVEDTPLIRTNIKNVLKPYYMVVEAENGIEGINLATEIIPDLIISDWMMPEMDGIEFCKRIKLDERTSHIPVIILTAKSASEDKIEGFETGADEYIIKPFDENILVVRVKNLIETRKKLQEKFSKSWMNGKKECAEGLSKVDNVFIKKVEAIIEKNISDINFNVETLYQEIAMSRSQCYRKITALTGLSPVLFIRNYRLRKAAEFLSSTENNVSQVMQLVGFNHHSYFSKCFKEIFGCQPSDYGKS